MEFIDSDLQKLMKLASDGDIDEDHVKYIMYNLLCGIKFLHSANIMHRDIKPANILIDGECRVKICDFGLARSRIALHYDDMDEYVESQLTGVGSRNNCLKKSINSLNNRSLLDGLGHSNRELILPPLTGTPKMR